MANPKIAYKKLCFEKILHKASTLEGEENISYLDEALNSSEYLEDVSILMSEFSSLLDDEEIFDEFNNSISREINSTIPNDLKKANTSKLNKINYIEGYVKRVKLKFHHLLYNFICMIKMHPELFQDKSTIHDLTVRLFQSLSFGGKGGLEYKAQHMQKFTLQLQLAYYENMFTDNYTLDNLELINNVLDYLNSEINKYKLADTDSLLAKIKDNDLAYLKNLKTYLKGKQRHYKEELLIAKERKLKKPKMQMPTKKQIILTHYYLQKGGCMKKFEEQGIGKEAAIAEFIEKQNLDIKFSYYKKVLNQTISKYDTRVSKSQKNDIEFVFNHMLSNCLKGKAEAEKELVAAIKLINDTTF